MSQPIRLSPIAQREGNQLRQLDRGEWPAASTRTPRSPVEVWLSRNFLVQVFDEDGATRISVNRTTMRGHRWVDGITWDELMTIKADIGRGDAWAVELYPPDSAVVDVANMRHLWLIDEEPAYAWRRPS